MRKLYLLPVVISILTLLLATAVLANPGKPSFTAQVYADGQAWGTKGAAALPPPNGHNDQSYDKLYVITNGVAGQLPVGEAGPGNPMYNGGRWWTHTVDFSTTPHAPVLLTSYGDGSDPSRLKFHIDRGHVTAIPGSPGGPGAPPDYFECPLLPVK
jgi:hypothetical protein